MVEKTFNLLLLLVITSVKSYLIGIDLGTQFFKINLLKPKSPFTMVENVQSKTKTPTNLILKDDERLFGADALNKKPRFPNHVFSNLHEFLGKEFNSTEVNTFIQKYFFRIQHSEDKERHSFNFHLKFNNKERAFNVEELFGMLFRYIKFLSTSFSGQEVVDCVVTTPSFYGYKERHAIAQAIQIANMNLLGFINENAAAALYAANENKVQFDKTKRSSTNHIIFYNIGASYTQATLVKYTNNVKHVGSGSTAKNSTTTSIEVLAEAWDRDLGGRNFDYGISKHLMGVFDKINSKEKSIKDDNKALERILPNAIKYKEVLSANKVVSVSILGVSHGLNLKTELTKETFESLFEDEFSRVYNPIQSVLDQAKLSIRNISQVEILGGGVRIPKIQSLLNEKINKDSKSNVSKLGQHMNGDDSMAFGAAMFAANFSSGYRTRQQTTFKHGPSYDLFIMIKTPTNKNILTRNGKNLGLCDRILTAKDTNTTTFAIDCVRSIDKNATIFKRFEQYYNPKKVNFKHDGDFEVEVYEQFVATDPKLLLTYKSKGVREIVASIHNCTEVPRISLVFTQDSKGLLDLKAEIHFGTYLYYATKNNSKGKPEFFFVQNETKPFTQEELKHFLNNNQSEFHYQRKKVGSTSYQYTKSRLELKVEYSFPKPLTMLKINEARKKLNKLDNFDKKRALIFEKKNSLESLLYDKKNWLDSLDSGESKYITNSEVEILHRSYKEHNEWFENESHNSTLIQLNRQIANLTKVFNIIEERKTLEEERVREKERFVKEINEAKTKARKIVKEKPWTEEYFQKNFSHRIRWINRWLSEIEEKQSKLALYEVPILTKESFKAKLSEVKEMIKNMNKLPKPQEEDSPPNIDDFLGGGKTIEELMSLKNSTKNSTERYSEISKNKSITLEGIKTVEKFDKNAKEDLR